MSRKREYGFTLIELLVVISIISLLASTLVASMVTARQDAQNAAMTQTASEYYTALMLLSAEKDAFPADATNSGPAVFVVCMGAGYTDGTCGESLNGGGYNLQENAQFNDLLKKYIPGLPAPNQVIMANNQKAWRGVVYGCLQDKGVCGKVVIYWALQGANKSCGYLGRDGEQKVDGNATFCIRDVLN
ncbi:MAG: type II secretion system protein [Minisyncoccota bacterium]